MSLRWLWNRNSQSKISYFKNRNIFLFYYKSVFYVELSFIKHNSIGSTSQCHFIIHKSIDQIDQKFNAEITAVPIQNGFNYN